MKKTIEKTDLLNNVVSEIQLVYKTKVKNSERKSITNSKLSADIFKSLEAYNQNIDFKEVFYSMYLNRANKLLAVLKISEGSTSGTVVDVKQIIKPAIDLNASGVIICHNHPSGNFKPSDHDKTITSKIINALKLFDISLIDAIIITSEGYYSFADEGILY